MPGMVWPGALGVSGTELPRGQDTYGRTGCARDRVPEGQGVPGTECPGRSVREDRTSPVGREDRASRDGVAGKTVCARHGLAGRKGRDLEDWTCPDDVAAGRTGRARDAVAWRKGHVEHDN